MVAVIISEPISLVLVNGWATGSAWFCLYFFYTRYVLERVLPKIYGSTYTKMSIPDQKSFTVHHHWLTVKFICLIGLFPYFRIMFWRKALTEPLIPGSHITNADMLSVLYLGIIASFLWEIASRMTISPVSLIHHISAVALSAWQLSGGVHGIPFSTEANLGALRATMRENDQQFKIIMTYGIFEVLFESWMHICCILHRVWEGDNYKRSILWRAGGSWVLVGTLAELGIMSSLWHMYWHSWSTGMKCVMIILHFAFMAAQLHGARIGLTLSFKYRNKHLAAKKMSNKDDIEHGTESTDSVDVVKPKSVEPEEAEKLKTSQEPAGAVIPDDSVYVLPLNTATIIKGQK